MPETESLKYDICSKQREYKAGCLDVGREIDHMAGEGTLEWRPGNQEFHSKETGFFSHLPVCCQVHSLPFPTSAVYHRACPLHITSLRLPYSSASS